MPRYQYGLIVLALLALLALSAIAQPAAAAQTPAADPAQQAADAARQAAEAAAPGPRFDPSRPGGGSCVGEPSEAERVSATTVWVDGSAPEGSNIPRTDRPYGAWQVSAPRGWPGPTRPGDPVALSLRDKFGTASRLVYADVYRPDRRRDRAGALLLGDSSAKLAYPTEYRDAQPLSAGTYTVVWRDTITDRFIACDGFVVER